MQRPVVPQHRAPEVGGRQAQQRAERAADRVERGAARGVCEVGIVRRQEGQERPVHCHGEFNGYPLICMRPILEGFKDVYRSQRTAAKAVLLFYTQRNMHLPYGFLSMRTQHPSGIVHWRHPVLTQPQVLNRPLQAGHPRAQHKAPDTGGTGFRLFLFHCLAGYGCHPKHQVPIDRD